ncbi:histidine phosphatase family protein [Cyanobium gracile UHCC 0139]|uniref:Histidine phosphatase family protein n=1 Tax=Cyanobium gracile UHCC 0139 TaxID=3110308 RepID=A0ABU5RW73_9CYAN|nr:histidine phosphatase family protein [Cyanobium gracile]MEA5392039.1 histidine phosphatase family protein [Cyanobium gracile UHCC 0139]
MPLRIVLVRHGLSSFNLEHRIQGRDDLSNLTEEGQLQARRTGEALAELAFTAVYSSPLQRASATTAALLACHGSPLAPVYDDDLLEIDLAPWSGLLRSEVRAVDPEQERRWREAPETMELRRADGSRFLPVPELLDQAGRFADGLLARHDDDDTVLVVAHNAILRCLVLHLLGLPASGFLRLRLDNASISVLNLVRGEDGRPAVQLESLNGTAHLGTALPPSGPGCRLLLVRHGETDWNREGRFQGQIDIPLNAHGLAQAEAARAFLALIPLQRAYSSDMARPLRTAEVILGSHPGVPLTTTRGLREIGHGLWEGRLESEIAAGWPDLLAAWKRTPETVQMPEGETIGEVWDRSLEAWKRIVAGLDPQETALVVAHDAVNKTILCALLGLSPADIWAIKQGNGGVTVIDYPRGATAPPVVSALNLTAHLGGVIDRTAAGAL